MTKTMMKILRQAFAKNRLIPLASGLVLLAGCATSQMKSTPFYTGDSHVYTGNAEDRVNLWPIGYYREPALSLMWPLFSATDDHLAVRPIYSQYRQGGRSSDYDEFNFIWPICQFDTRHGSNRFFPFFWTRNSYTLFPLIFWRPGDYFRVFPLFWSDNYGTTLFPVYHYKPGTLVTPLLGWSDESSWVLPIYCKTKKSFVTLPFALSGSGDSRSWYSPLFFSWGDRSESVFLLGLFGSSHGEGGADSDWLMPLYYRNPERFLSLPWCTWKRNDVRRHFIPPLLTYFNSQGDFFTPIYGDFGNEKYFPPLLSSYETHGNGAAGFRFLLGLGGCKTVSGGDFNRSWLFPLWYADGRKFLSLPFAHDDEMTSVAVIAGVRHGKHKKGGWLWPLFGWNTDSRMAAAEAMFNADELPSSVTVGERYHDAVGGAVSAASSSWFLSGLSSCDRRIRWSVAGDGSTNRQVVATEYRDCGNFPTFKREFRRSVKFDMETRKKTLGDEFCDCSLFGNLLWHSKYEKSAGVETYCKKSLLWRLWHYEKLRGDVSVDAFPFFTYDAKKDGRSKTALLWRLFRNEWDPEKGRSVDLFFIPIWR